MKLRCSRWTQQVIQSDFGSLHKNTNVEGGTLNIGGTTYAKGLGMNRRCVATYNIPTDKIRAVQGVRRTRQQCRE